MDPVSVGALLTSLKTAKDLLKDWRKGGDDVKVSRDKLSELTSAVLDAQEHAMEARQAQYDLVQRNDELEKKLKTCEAWREEKESYKLINVGVVGAFVYAPKSGAMQEDAPHWLCQICFDASTKSVLQFSGTIPHETGRIALWRCTVCKVHVSARPSTSPS